MLQLTQWLGLASHNEIPLLPSETIQREWKTWEQNQNKYLNEILIFSSSGKNFLKCCYYSIFTTDTNTGLDYYSLFFSERKKYFTSLITFSFSATFIANRFLNHHVSLFPMLPLTGFNQMSFTTVKTNVSPHPLKHIWKRAVKKIYQIKNELWRLFSCTWESASNMHFKN